MLNYWPSFFEGIDHAKHVQNVHNSIDRQDNVNGWGSPLVNLVQRALHPYLLLDVGIMEDPENLPDLEADRPRSDWHEVGEGNIQWPRNLPRYARGDTVERRIEIFNGGLSGNKLSLKWSAHWDSPGGPVAVAGETLGPLEIQPGFHATETIRFPLPATDKDERRLYLVLN